LHISVEVETVLLVGWILKEPVLFLFELLNHDRVGIVPLFEELSLPPSSPLQRMT